MLTPINNSTSVTATTSKKLTTIDKPYLSLGPDFFKPLTTETGLSCTYPPEFYEAFGQNSHSSQHSELALLILEYMTLHDKARLPLFTGASDRYVKQVLPAIREKLATKNGDDDTLATKIHIINCASQLGYLKLGSIIFKDSVILNRVSLIGINLRNAYLDTASLQEADLSGVNLYRANLSMANLKNAHLTGTDLRKTNLIWAILSGANLSRANLSGADIRGASVLGADLSESNLIKTNLSDANLSGSNLQGVNLSGANLSHANLSGTDLSKANLNGANLSEANLSNSNLSGANLAGANISRALLRKADLRGANLHQINLKEADLTGAKLCNTNRLLLVEISKIATKPLQ